MNHTKNITVNKKGNLVKVQLKPCPFCGGEASTKTITYSDNCDIVKLNGIKKYHGINCTKCGSSNDGIIGFRTEREAINHWNKRII